MAKTSPGDIESIVDDYTALWNGDVSKLEVVPESVDVYVPAPSEGEVHGRDAFESHLRDLRAGVPDWHVTVDDTLAEDGVVTKEWTVTATHESEYSGVPPTGRSMGSSGMAKILIENGKVQGNRLYYGFHDLIEQLGRTDE